MNLHQLRCFVAAAEELHFGKAAHRLAMLPAALGRYIRQLEEDLGTRLLVRTTRNVTLTADGATLLEDARSLLAQADALASRFRMTGRNQATTLRVGAIDSAAAGLMPALMQDFRSARPDIAVQIHEDKTIRLLPRLLSGSLDLAFVRPPPSPDKNLEFLFLLYETVVVAVSEAHPLATRDYVEIKDIADQNLIVPDRRSRPHSHDLTITLFAEAGLRPRLRQIAEEKQTIVSLVAAGLGVALVPRWTARMATTGLRYIPLNAGDGRMINKLPLAVAWVGGTRDTVRDEMLDRLRNQLGRYSEQA
jgi:DNA-binding transcriptional LysR family regulator